MIAPRLTVLALCAPFVLAACASGPSPLLSEPVRPGVDKAVPQSASLPPAPAGRYEPGIVPENEEEGATVGQLVADKGGQKAQKEKDKKEQAAVEADLARQRAEQARQRNVDEKISNQ